MRPLAGSLRAAARFLKLPFGGRTIVGRETACTARRGANCHCDFQFREMARRRRGMQWATAAATAEVRMDRGPIWPSALRPPPGWKARDGRRRSLAPRLPPFPTLLREEGGCAGVGHGMALLDMVSFTGCSYPRHPSVARCRCASSPSRKITGEKDNGSHARLAVTEYRYKRMKRGSGGTPRR